MEFGSGEGGTDDQNILLGIMWAVSGSGPIQTKERTVINEPQILRYVNSIRF